MEIVIGLWLCIGSFLVGSFIERRIWKEKMGGVFADADLYVESELSRSGNGCMKLLDRDEVVVVFKNTIGSYSAASITPNELPYMPLLNHIAKRGNCDQLEGDGTPTAAMHNLSERRMKTGRYANQTPRPKPIAKQPKQKPAFEYVWVSCDICLMHWIAPTYGKSFDELGSVECPSCSHPCDLRNVSMDNQTDDDPDAASGCC